MKRKGELIAALAIVIMAIVFLYQNAQIQANLAEGEEAWGGADGSAAELLEEQGYVPWMQPIWEPPSGEIESLLFSLQAAIGAGIIGYFFGYNRGKRQGE
ncbi:MAG: energy-coupling factor ABC transporter substrate-binding protein [Methanomicrobiales archaeon]|nr:energy-coupling factor ABC transporter substrate-binding protein [Methanomicrobiales archaeon]MDI6876434.1 energy-coupling factor ABC transporter substrate-binding protein [Methanomicrobiales archaeon]